MKSFDKVSILAVMSTFAAVSPSYGACETTDGINFSCAGANADPISIEGIDLNITTQQNFSIDTVGTYDYSALYIAGNGNVSYIDEHNSVLNGTNFGLFISNAAAVYAYLFVDSNSITLKKAVFENLSYSYGSTALANINLNLPTEQVGVSLINVGVSSIAYFNVQQTDYANADIRLQVEGFSAYLNATLNFTNHSLNNNQLVFYTIAQQSDAIAIIDSIGSLTADVSSSPLDVWTQADFGNAFTDIRLNDVTGDSGLYFFSIAGIGKTSELQIESVGTITAAHDGIDVRYGYSNVVGDFNTVTSLKINSITAGRDAVRIENNTTGTSYNYITTYGDVVANSGTAIYINTTAFGKGGYTENYLTVSGLVKGGNAAIHILTARNSRDRTTLELRPGYDIVGATVLRLQPSELDVPRGNLVLGGSGIAEFDLSRINVGNYGAGIANRISGFNTLSKIGDSVWTLRNDNTRDPLDALFYANVNAGTLSLDNATIALRKVSEDEEQLLPAGSASGTLSVASDAVLSVHGASTVLGDVANSGSVVLNPCSTCAGNTLSISGDYIGTSGSIVSIGTVLGDDTSLTDKLIVNGNTSGSSLVRVTNEIGNGAQTAEGIEIITVGGNSDGVFTLLGDNSSDYIVAGAYTYRLHKNNTSGTDPNDWYLRSAIPIIDPGDDGEDEEDDDAGGDADDGAIWGDDEGTIPPVLRPEYHVGSPVYETYPQALLGLNGLSTLQQRVGNRFWAGSGNRVIAEGADAIVPYAAPEEAGVHFDGNGVWGRIEGSHNSIDPRFSTTGTEYRQNTFKLQAGVDGLLTENENGTLIGGIFVQYVHGKTKTNSGNYADGEISTDGYGFGGTLTWYGNDGFYIDSQAQVTWYNSDLTTSAFGAPTLTDGNNGIGYALSLETGKRFAIDPEWSITPQAQLVYSSVDFDDFTDGFGSHVSLDRGDSLQGRLGITLDHENSWQNAKGLMNRSHVYGIANLYYEFLEGTKVNIEDVSFASKKDRLWGGIGVGGSYNWDNDKYSIYGEGIVNTSLNNFGDSYSLKGNVGFRVKW